MREFIYRLGSRKFLLVVGAVAVALANKDYNMAVKAALVYVGVEGAADLKSR